MSKSKKAYVVYPRTKQVSREGLRVRGKKKKFIGTTFMNVNENDAAAIRDTYTKDEVHIVEDEQLARALKGEKWEVTNDNQVKTLHHYTFGALTGKARDNYDRIFRKKRK